ncbi:hypothetical protein O181_041771 [Austropuccinia psidii MF-1]|uniref:Mitochondrial outer membrane protein IML2 n=1 Tax=Austropuccinia psidii MF-1 TaxID=1389203 RepID=A0A9Q3DKB9_9BASI|nr:hypothetical protein [Austropuccinia psidii MF-1]
MTSPECIHDANRAFGLVFQDDLVGARTRLQNQSNETYSHVALGFIYFIEAALGMEDQMIAKALDTLLKVEESIKQAKATLISSSNEKQSTVHWWVPGLEYDIMLADVLIFQAILHFMTETVSDSVKGIYKLGKSYKLFSSSYQSVFSNISWPESTTNTKSLHPDIATDIEPFIEIVQEHYSTSKLNPSTLASNSTSYIGAFTLGGFMRKKTRTGQLDQVNLKPYEKWLDDPIASLVMGGTAFGYGLFGLALTFLPNKIKKPLSWVGFGASISNERSQTMLERNKCNKWLLFSFVGCKWEIHGKLAGLTLLTYRATMLTTLGWIASRERSLEAYATLVDSFAKVNSADDQNGTLCVLHQSKVYILQGNVLLAKNLLLQKINSIKVAKEPLKLKQIVGVLSYELALVHVHMCEWVEAGEAFLELKKENAWSHFTYQLAALGCFLLVQDKSEILKNRIDNLFKELPMLANKKQGKAPPIEALLGRKLTQYKTRHSELIAEGRIASGREECYWDSIQITPIEEFSILLSAYDHMPAISLRSNIKRLCSLSPKIEIPDENLGNLSQQASIANSNLGLSVDEIYMRNILLGTQLSALGNYKAARMVLEKVDLKSTQEPHNYMIAIIQRALVELREGDLTPNDLEKWKQNFQKANKLLDMVLNLPDNYLMKGRMESKVQLIKDEMNEKKEQLGIAP